MWPIYSVKIVLFCCLIVCENFCQPVCAASQNSALAEVSADDVAPAVSFAQMPRNEEEVQERLSVLLRATIDWGGGRVVRFVPGWSGDGWLSVISPDDRSLTRVREELVRVHERELYMHTRPPSVVDFDRLVQLIRMGRIHPQKSGIFAVGQKIGGKSAISEAPVTPGDQS